MSDAVLYAVTGGIAKITLNHPDRRNVLSFELVAALNEALEKAANDSAVRVVLLAAEGKAFCAGMDLKRIALDDEVDAANFSTMLAEAYGRLLRLPMPLLCAVDGPAMGGAVGLALAADLVWVGPTAKFAFPETRVGVVPALVSVPARRRMAPGKLMGMLVAGIPAGPKKAVRLGLADFAVEGSALADAELFAEQLVKENSDEAMRRTKAFAQQEFGASLDAELAAATAEFREAVKTKAAARGLAAFRNKTPLVWNEP
jgi:enoyl-CoA hydratase/carnithine racemase